MKRLALLITASLFLVVTASAQVKYTTYTNKRFSFSIDYPSSVLKMQPPPANDDGRTFLSESGDVELRAWGEFNSLEQTLEQRFRSDLAEYGDGVSYQKLLANGFVISGVREDRIYYQKTLYHKLGEAEIFYTFTFEYPQKRRRAYDPIVRRLAASFKFDPNANV